MAPGKSGTSRFYTERSGYIGVPVTPCFARILALLDLETGQDENGRICGKTWVVLPTTDLHQQLTHYDSLLAKSVSGSPVQLSPYST